MTKKPKISKDDIDLFQHAMKGVKPLSAINKIRVSPKTRPKIVSPPKITLDLLEHEVDQEIDKVGSEDYIAYKHASISNKTLRKLRKGQYNVEAILDLHGNSVSEAKCALNLFLQNALRSKMRVVLIIHGKGRNTPMPILKNKLNQWLTETKVVLAFCSATKSHGSRGAIYVMLKRTRSELV